MTCLSIFAKSYSMKKQRYNFNGWLQCGQNTAVFLDKIYSTSLIPQITSSTRVTPGSKTFIDNIFATDANAETLSGNSNKCLR